MALAISDILLSFKVYVNYLPHRETNISLCRFEGWWRTTMSEIQLFVSVLVVDHLSRILRLQEAPLHTSVKNLWLLVLAVSVFGGILAAIPIFTDDYKMREQMVCWIPGDTTFRVYFRFFLVYGIVWICIIYSIIRMAQVFRYYNEKSKQIEKKPLSIAFKNPVIKESASVKDNTTITFDSDHQSTSRPKIPSLILSRLSLRVGSSSSSSVQKQDNMTTEDRIMRVVKTLCGYPVVDLVCWLPFAVFRTIHLIQYVEGKPLLEISTLEYYLFMCFLHFMGLGHAVIFFCNQKVRRTLSEYISRTLLQKKIDPKTNLQPHAHFRRESLELTSV